MSSNFVHMTCSKETKESIMTDCIEEYLRHHPDMKGIRITERFILEQMRKFYLEIR